MKRTYTVITCDRCSTEKTYEHGSSMDFPPRPDEWHGEWANVYPSTAAAFGCLPNHYSIRPLAVCENCLTDDEREQVTRQRLEINADFPVSPAGDDIPF